MGRSGIAPCEHRVAGRGAHRAGDVRIVEKHAFASKAVEVGRENFSAVGACLRLIIVIDQEEDDVGPVTSVRWRGDRVQSD